MARLTKNGNTYSYKRYRCGSTFSQYHGGACISETVIERYLLSHVTEKSKNEVLNLSQQKKEMEKESDESIKIKAEIERLNNMYQKGHIKEAYYDEQYAILL